MLRSRALTIFPIALLCGTFPCATVVSVAEATDHRTVTVCIDPWDDPGVMMPAQLKASTIFERVGVRIRWLHWRCPDNVIRITFDTDTPPAHLPGTLAYALAPSQTITVFYDRVKRTVESWRLNYVLAHVIAHEITHILQGRGATLRNRTDEARLGQPGLQGNGVAWPYLHGGRHRTHSRGSGASGAVTRVHILRECERSSRQGSRRSSLA